MAKEKMMRSIMIIAAIILAACGEPPIKTQALPQQQPPVSPTIEITAPREMPEAPKAKELKPQTPKVAPAQPAQSVHPCAGIETGDARTDVKAKLECLEEHG
jgi:hypothetical protein